MSDETEMQPVRVLLVDDNEADVYLFRQALKCAGVGAELIVIADGAAALTFVRDNHPPDMAVLDLNLPKHGGLEVVQAIRERVEWSEVPIVVLSSSLLTAEQETTAALAVNRCILKPPDLEPFLRIGDTVRELLDESKKAPTRYRNR